jgi:hypothetical protein
VDDPVDAIERALAMSGHEDLICVTGSFHVAGAIRTHLVPAAVGLDPIVPAHEAARRAS